MLGITASSRPCAAQAVLQGLINPNEVLGVRQGMYSRSPRAPDGLQRGVARRTTNSVGEEVSA